MERNGTPDFGSFAAARIPGLLRFGFALTGSTAGAEDLVQEALVRVGLRWATVSRRGDPEGYIRRTMANLHVSWWRTRRRELLSGSVPERAAPDDPGHELWPFIVKLPPRQRAVLALRYYEDLTEAETAEALGCSVGTVKSQSAKAIAKLRSELGHTTMLETT